MDHACHRDGRGIESWFHFISFSSTLHLTLFPWFSLFCSREKGDGGCLSIREALLTPCPVHLLSCITTCICVSFRTVLYVQCLLFRLCIELCALSIYSELDRFLRVSFCSWVLFDWLVVWYAMNYVEWSSRSCRLYRLDLRLPRKDLLTTQPGPVILSLQSLVIVCHGPRLMLKNEC